MIEYSNYRRLNGELTPITFDQGCRYVFQNDVNIFWLNTTFSNFRTFPAASQWVPRVFWNYLVRCSQRRNGNPSCRFSVHGVVSPNKLAFHCWCKTRWMILKHYVYCLQYLIARRVVNMCDYLVLMTYVDHFSLKFQLSCWSVSCLLVYAHGGDHCVMPAWMSHKHSTRKMTRFASANLAIVRSIFVLNLLRNNLICIQIRNLWMSSWRKSISHVAIEVKAEHYRNEFSEWFASVFFFDWLILYFQEMYKH